MGSYHHRLSSCLPGAENRIRNSKESNIKKCRMFAKSRIRISRISPPARLPIRPGGPSPPFLALRAGPGRSLAQKTWSRSRASLVFFDKVH